MFIQIVCSHSGSAHGFTSFLLSFLSYTLLLMVFAETFIFVSRLYFSYLDLFRLFIFSCYASFFVGGRGDYLNSFRIFHVGSLLQYFILFLTEYNISSPSKGWSSNRDFH